MALRFDHLGVVATNLSFGRDHLAAIFYVSRWTEEFEDPINNVFVQFGLDQSNQCYELIAPRNKESPVTVFLKKKTDIFNHVAYLVASLPMEVNRLREHRCMPIGDPKPAVAYGGRNIQFLLSPMGFIFELIEAPDHNHIYRNFAS
jgi:methylmalonyl-CoA/ethylmalonyl-CoA epimerase